MRVFQINSFFSVGGPPRVVKGIYDTLIENGDECVLAASREKPIDGMNTIRIGNKFTTYRAVLMSRLFDMEGFSAKYATKKLIKEIEKYNPDIIHLHNLHGYYINIEVLFNFLKQYNKPVIWTLHDCWALTGHCANFSYIKCDKWLDCCYDCPQKKKYPSCNLLDNSTRNYKNKKVLFNSVSNMTIVTPSQWLADLVKRSFLSNNDVRVINNGIDLELFRPLKSDLRQQYNIGDKKIILGVAQNWGERKGLEDMEALAQIIDINKYQIVLIGLTDKQQKEIDKKIIGLTRTNNIEELIAWYTTADVFLNTTYEDNFPTVNLEALACGTPIITYETGGSSEAIDESCGWVVPQGDLTKIKEIISNLELKESMTESCLNRAKNFERNKKYKEYIALYK